MKKELPTRMLAINKECDRKNRIYNIIGWSQSQIETKKATFSKKDWVVLIRYD